MIVHTPELQFVNNQPKGGNPENFHKVKEHACPSEDKEELTIAYDCEWKGRRVWFAPLGQASYTDKGNDHNMPTDEQAEFKADFCALPNIQKQLQAWEKQVADARDTGATGDTRNQRGDQEDDVPLT